MKKVKVNVKVKVRGILAMCVNGRNFISYIFNRTEGNVIIF